MLPGHGLAGRRFWTWPCPCLGGRPAGAGSADPGGIAAGVRGAASRPQAGLGGPCHVGGALPHTAPHPAPAQPELAGAAEAVLQVRRQSTQGLLRPRGRSGKPSLPPRPAGRDESQASPGPAGRSQTPALQSRGVGRREDLGTVLRSVCPSDLSGVMES